VEDDKQKKEAGWKLLQISSLLVALAKLIEVVKELFK
jgi:hypothetical protein